MSTVLDQPSLHVPLHRIPVPKKRWWTADRALGVALAALGATVVAWGLNLFPALLGDEGIYTSQAFSTLHGELTPYTYTYDHPFAGWLQLAPLQGLVRLFAGNDELMVVSGRVVMVAYAFVSLLFVFHIARRLGIGRVYAGLAVLLLTLSPLYITESREVLLDNIALPWVLGAFYLALTPSRRQWLYGLSGMMFGVGVLSKETVVIVLPALAYVIWTRAYRPIRSMSIASFVTLGTMVVLSYPLFALLRNELLPGPRHVSLWSNGIMYQLASRKGSGFVFQPGSARAGLVHQWLALDTVILAVGFGSAVACLFIARVRFIGLAIFLWALPVLKPGGYLPQMYVVLVIPFCALAAAGVVDAVGNGLARSRGSRLTTRLLPVLVAVAAVIGLVNYIPKVRHITTDRGNNQVAVTARAEAYLKTRITKADNVLVDPSYWGDLVVAGLNHPWQGAIVYYQFDLDPLSSGQYMPQGWQDVDYVVETNEMRDNLTALGLTKLSAAIKHSTVVARFGSGGTLVLVRAVEATPYNQKGVR
jgi:4-amino-4-deoxy-L-arabinose transferase-like glycosyltransferase